jgi:UDP-N-acetylmuramoylalanine--D-glutamate ligase
MIDVRKKRVLVVGLGRSGRAVALCLRRRDAIVTVTDIKPPSAFGPELPELLAEKIGMELGSQRVELFLTHDLIVVSPGVQGDLPQLQAARARGIPVVPEIEVAGWYLSDPIVGVTGSNGKTTTTALLGKMLEASGFSTFVGGNIGVPLSSAVDRLNSGSIIVAELSSFQLEAIRDFRPHVAVLLNLSPNHLDRHPSLEAYAQAKRQIFRNQRGDDYAILNADDPWVRSLGPALASRKVFFSRFQEIPFGLFVSNGNIVYRTGHLERVLLETREVRLRGDFNLEDVLGAAAAACVLGADFDAVRNAVREFEGVEHRLEYVRTLGGVEFYNNSKATSVDATVKSLEAFEQGVHLILGGKDKGAPYAPLLPRLKDRVREVLLIGAAAERIAQELSGAVKLVRAGDLESAVRAAFRHARPGDVVLLAPACSSFDQFQDFEHRGRVFKELVARLAQEVESGSVEWKWKAESPAGSSPEAAATAPEAPVEPPLPELETPRLMLASGVPPQAEGELQPSEELAQELVPPPKLNEAQEASYSAAETATEEAPVPAEAAGQPEKDRFEEKSEQAAGADAGDSTGLLIALPATATPQGELPLVYEISGEDLPPAETELESDYSEPSETSQLLTSASSEGTRDAPLPYEARDEGRPIEAGDPVGRSAAEGGGDGRSSPVKRSRKEANRRKPKPVAPEGTTKPVPPGTD